MLCALCSKQAAAEFKPFCSRRCADIDLNRWFSGAYALPAEELPDEQELEAMMHDLEEGKK